MELVLNFEYEKFPVRTLYVESVIWFALKDVCTLLGIMDDKQVYDRLDDDERGRYKIPTPGGLQRIRCVNEPGLYDVIIRSNSEKSKPFRRWITHDVLPSIRKQGFYSVLSDCDLLQLMIKRSKESAHFLDSWNKSVIRSQIACDERKSCREQIISLWDKRNTMSCQDYKKELSHICGNNHDLYLKQLDRYEKWMDFVEMYTEYKNGKCTISDVCWNLNMSSATWYKRVRELEGVI